MKKKKNLTYIALTAILAVLTYIFSLNVKDVKAGSGNCSCVSDLGNVCTIYSEWTLDMKTVCGC